MNKLDNNGLTSLMDAAKSNMYNRVKNLLHCGEDPSIKSEEGKTFWDYFSEDGKKKYADKIYGQASALQIVKDSVSQEYFNGNLNSKDNFGNTPLALSCILCHLDDVLFLIAEGVDVNIPNNAGMSPLDLAKRFPHPASVKIVEALIAAGAKQLDRV